jgi:hypothetical protein
MTQADATVTKLATRPPAFQVSITTLDEAWRFAEIISQTEMVPKQYRGKAGDCLVAMQMGAELGLSPLAALQNIAVINGRPSLWGDAMLALVQSHPQCVDVIETADAAAQTATCTVKRKGRADVVRSFSMDDARRANLAGKQGPWTEYPKRMCQMRARAWALRDSFADALRGLSMAEEAEDMVEAVVTGSRTIASSHPALPETNDNARKSEPPPAPAPNRTAPVMVQARPEDFAIMGKNRGKTMGQMSDEQLAWYATECKDAAHRTAAQAVLENRITAQTETPHDPETGEVLNAGEAAQ